MAQFKIEVSVSETESCTVAECMVGTYIGRTLVNNQFALTAVHGQQRLQLVGSGVGGSHGSE